VYVRGLQSDDYEHRESRRESKRQSRAKAASHVLMNLQCIYTPSSPFFPLSVQQLQAVKQPTDHAATPKSPSFAKRVLSLVLTHARLKPDCRHAAEACVTCPLRQQLLPTQSQQSEDKRRHNQAAQIVIQLETCMIISFYRSLAFSIASTTLTGLHC
jgi:hypothetical protein